MLNKIYQVVVILLKKTGDAMTSDLLLAGYVYPIHGDLRKVIDYGTMREIFLSKKKGGTMEQALNMSNHHIENVKTPLSNDHAANKLYVDDEAAKRLSRSGGTMTGDINMNNKKRNNLITDYKDIKWATNVGYVNNKVNTAKGDVTIGLKNYFDKKDK